MHSALDYWSIAVYPRTRLREPYPRSRRRAAVSLFPGAAGPSSGTPERTFVAGSRSSAFTPYPRTSAFVPGVRSSAFVPSMR